MPKPTTSIDSDELTVGNFFYKMANMAGSQCLRPCQADALELPESVGFLFMLYHVLASESMWLF